MKNLALWAVVASVAGCGFDEYYTGLGDKALPGDPLNPIRPDIVMSCGPSGSLAVDLTGMAWRFDSIALSEPTTLLNSILADQVEGGQMNLLLVADSYDKDSGHLKLRVGSATLEGEAYRIGPDASTIEGTVAGASLSMDQPSTLLIPAEPFLTPPVLKVSNMRMSWTFAPDGSAITNGKLDGVLKGTDAASVQTGGKDLGSLLTQVNFPPTLDLEPEGAPDGVPDSWPVKGEFTAARVQISL